MLINQSGHDNLPERFGWANSVISNILAKFENKAGTRNGFPCIYGHNSVRRGNVLFLLVPYDRDTSCYELPTFADGLRSYIDQVDFASLDPSKHRPLLTLFEPVDTFMTADQFEHLFIEAMLFLIDNDRSPWPVHIPKDPEHHAWTMCFHDCELFVNVSHPAHILRRSRNLGAGLAFVINPRRIFDIAAPDDPTGRQVMAATRHNIDIYDDVPHSSLLGSYLLGEAQWPQYMIPDNNDVPPLRCRLRFK